MRRSVPALVALLALGLAAPAGAQDVPPDEAGREARTTCDAGLATRPARPVVLLHGTGVDSELNWSWGYAKDLRERGHGVCTFDLPRRGAIDVQDSVRLTRAAIRKAASLGGGRRVAVVGHSQGGAQAMLALRLFPELGVLVDDVVTLAGVFDGGSEAVRDGCADGCSPAFHQFATGSRLLAALRSRPLPRSVDLTAIGTLADDVVTPQPAANAVAGGRSIQLQDLCPGRRLVPGLDHIYLAADAVAHALAIDALGHDGTADPGRVDRRVCALQVFPQADLVAFAALTPRLLAAFGADGSADEVAAEPALRCPLAPGCAGDALLVQSARLVGVRGGHAVLRVRAGAPVRLRLVAAGRPRASVRVAAGRRTVRLRAGAARRAVLQARPAAGGAWVPVRVLELRRARG